MHPNTPCRKKGFTLIELSIVLVIVGLLIGGIVAGRSLLRQSEVTSTIVDAQKYVAAVQAFQQKYNALPGDMPNATTSWGIAAGSTGTDATCWASSNGGTTGTATCNGNGDGQINYTGTYANETLRMWQHLVNAGFISGSFSGNGAGYIVGSNGPAGTVAGLGFGLVWVGTNSGGSPYPVAFDGVYGHIITIGGTYGAGYPPVAGVLTGDEAQSLDSKFDDGSPALGNIRTWKNGGFGLTCASSTAVTATYSTISTNKVCSMLMITGF